MATAKYATTVANPDGRRVTFAAGDDLPAWALKAITNRDAIDGSSEAPAAEPEPSDEEQSEESEPEQPGDDSDTAPEPEPSDDAAPAAQGRRGRKPAAGADAK